MLYIQSLNKIIKNLLVQNSLYMIFQLFKFTLITFRDYSYLLKLYNKTIYGFYLVHYVTPNLMVIQSISDIWDLTSNSNLLRKF